MKIGKKGEARAKRLVEFLMERIAAEEERFSLWDRALSILESLRFNRKVRAFSLTRSIPLPEKTEFFQRVFQNNGISLPEEASGVFLSVLILEDLWDALPYCRSQLQKRFFDETGQVEVSIESAQALPEGEKKRLNNCCRKSWGI